MAIHVSPAQESHRIGSRVTLNCTATPSPQTYENLIFPLTFRWYFPDRGSSYSRSASILTTTIVSYDQSLGNSYCLIYRRNSLLGKARTTFNVKGNSFAKKMTVPIHNTLACTLLLYCVYYYYGCVGILKPTMSANSSISIQALQEQRVTLQVNISDHSVVNQLLELTWYHNGSKLVPRNDPRLLLSSNNMTLTITNFTSSYSGLYKAQFDQLLVSPFDENCKNEVLYLMRHHPILKPAVFCINMESDCSDIADETWAWKISIRSVNSTLQETFDSLTLVADAKVLSYKELEHSSIYWYRNGIFIYHSTSSLQKNYNTLSLSQTFQQFNTAYEHSGRYEVLLKVNTYTYLQAGNSRSPCQLYYNRFVSPYSRSGVTLAKGFIDIGYHKGKRYFLSEGLNFTFILLFRPII